MTTDTNGGTAGGSTTQTRTHNSQNQITAVSGATTPTYNGAGDMLSDEMGTKYTYDAWGDTIKVKTSAGTDKVTYTVDALGRRAAQTIGTAGVGTSTRYYFSDQWQVLQEDELNGANYTPRYQQVFSPVYVDAVVERDTLDATAVGDFDPTFSPGGTDGDGKLVKSIAGTGVDGIRFVQQSDQKIVGAGDAGGHIGMVRVNADGSLDTSFDGPGVAGNGVFSISLGTSDSARALAVQDDGKIVILGVSDGNVLVGRLNAADGSWDTGFDGPLGTGNGHFTLDFGATDTGWGVALQPDGKIVFCGVSGSKLLLGRLNTDGTYDASFDGPNPTPGNGAFTVDLDNNAATTDRALKVAIDHNGKIVVVGDTTGGTGGDVTVERFNAADGTYDNTFDSDGRQTTSLSAGQDTARGVAIDDRNRVLVAAYGDGNFDAVRYTTAGALDTSFDGDGKVSVDMTAGTDQAESVALDPLGRVLVSGSVNGQKDWGIVRLNADGSADSSFWTGGKRTFGFSANNNASEICYTMLVQPDGRILLAGLSDVDVAVARLSGGGARHYLVQDANYNATATVDAAGTVWDR